MTLSFSKADDEILVEGVANHPLLWHLSHASHKDKEKRENIWKEISNKIGKPTGLCKKRWRNIKDTYDKKRTKRAELGEPTRKGKKWVLDEKLSFLKAAEEHRGSFSNVSDVLEDEVNSLYASDEEMLPTQSSTTTPTELRISSPFTEETEDDVDLFFKSLAKSVQKLTPAFQQRAKIETLNVITNLETEMWNQLTDL